MALKERIRKTFLELIAIDGIYPHEDAVTAYVEKRLREAGVAFEKDAFRNIIAKIPGAGEPIMFSTHLDIPEPAPRVRFVEEGERIISDGSGILGADPKTGLAILVEFLIAMAGADHGRHGPIEAVLTRGEETGLLGARNLDYSKVSAKVGLVLDEDGPVTQIVVQAPAYVRFDATCIGKIVHPREPEKGINALEVLTRALHKIPWGYSAKGVTWNVGQFEAGTARNSVPGRASFKAELRSFDTAHAISEGERIEGVLKESVAGVGAECRVEKEVEFEGYHLEREHSLFERLERTFKTLGLTPHYFATYGGSDANIFNAHGITCVPIGSGYHNAHEYTEVADLKDMAEIFEFLRNFVALV